MSTLHYFRTGPLVSTFVDFSTQRVKQYCIIVNAEHSKRVKCVNSVFRCSCFCCVMLLACLRPLYDSVQAGLNTATNEHYVPPTVPPPCHAIQHIKLAMHSSAINGQELGIYHILEINNRSTTGSYKKPDTVFREFPGLSSHHTRRTIHRLITRKT